MPFFLFDQTKIPYSLVKGKLNRIRIRFDSDLLIVETGTGQLSADDLSFIEDKKRWITKNYLRLKQAKDELLTTQASLEDSVRIFGEAVPVQYENHHKTAYRLNQKGLIIYAPSFDNKSILVASALFFYAKQYLKKRTLEIAHQLGYELSNIRIKNLRSKWGSCSSKKNINLNWRLIFLAPFVVDYVIIHELCHLTHMNHSSEFWNLVSQFCPTYVLAEEKLKEEAWVLKLYVEA